MATRRHLTDSFPRAPAQPQEQRRWIGYTVAAASAFAFFLGGVFYRRPFWIIDESMRAWLRLAGVRSKYVQLGAFRIHYFVGGRGRPLVLVHGLGGKAENWVSMIPTLMHHGHQVYALDLLGFGRSDRPDVDYSIALQTEILTQFFDSQNLSRADLGGWSMGGWVALKFVLDHPERVRRIFVVDSAGMNFNPHFGDALFQPATVDEAQQLLKLLTPQAHLIPRFVARDLMREMRPTRPVVQRFMKSMMAGGDLLDGKLRGIQAPVLIAWGKEDALIPVVCGEEMHRQMPQSVLAIFDGCGHLLPAESSGRLLPETLRFLEAEPPLPASVRVFPQ
jgi:pimeloyl-ACP methyl ester carboxylesterase